MNHPANCSRDLLLLHPFAVIISINPFWAWVNVGLHLPMPARCHARRPEQKPLSNFLDLAALHRLPRNVSFYLLCTSFDANSA